MSGGAPKQALDTASYGSFPRPAQMSNALPAGDAIIPRLLDCGDNDDNSGFQDTIQDRVCGNLGRPFFGWVELLGLCSTDVGVSEIRKTCFESTVQ